MPPNNNPRGTDLAEGWGGPSALHSGPFLVLPIGPGKEQRFAAPHTDQHSLQRSWGTTRLSNRAGNEISSSALFQ